MILTTAYGLGFIFGLALVLRPFLLLGALILRPALLGVVGLVGAGAVVAFPNALSSPSPDLTTGLGATALGAFAGLLLRSLFRGGA